MLLILKWFGASVGLFVVLLVVLGALGLGDEHHHSPPAHSNALTWSASIR
jgi:hypothetical protein